MIGPSFVEIAQSTNKDNADGKIKFYKIDVDSNASAAEAAKISAMPTFKASWFRVNAISADSRKIETMFVSTILFSRNATRRFLKPGKK